MSRSHDDPNKNWANVPILAILLFQFAALIVRSALDVQLRDKGFDPVLAENLSYLVVPPLFLLFMVPVWKQHGTLIMGLFKRKDLTWRAAGTGFSLALVIWLAVLLTDIAISAYKIAYQHNSATGAHLKFGVMCEQYLHMTLGIVVTALIIPIIEEVVNRGFILHFLLRRGRLFAVFMSALLFAILHKPESFSYTFVAGVYFAYLTLNHATLWSATIAHSVYNLAVQVNKNCMNFEWTRIPSGGDVATASLCAAMAVLVLLVFGAYLVAPNRAGPR